MRLKLSHKHLGSSSSLAGKERISDMIPVNEPLLAGNESRYVDDCLRSGWISSAGDYIGRFEADWAAYCGRKHGITVSNGTAALQIAVEALQLAPGDEIIIPSFTIISCVTAAIRAGATPVLVDCDPETYTCDPTQVAAAITPRTRAIMPVHIYGHPVDMDPILDVADKYGLKIIEDAAEAHGAEYLSRRNGREIWARCGSFGTLSVFSFFANKLITTGEGGMVVTDDDGLAERCRSLRNLCFLPTRRFYHEEFGHNFRLTNVQAAIGVAQVERMDDILKRKRRMGILYSELLGNVPGITLQTVRHWARVNYWMYGLTLDDNVRMDAVAFASQLRQKGVETRPFFMGMHEQPVFHKRGLFHDLHLPVTERMYERGLYLPSGLAITTEQISEVADAVISVLAQ
jgi:perosamine synthetase